MKDNKRLNIENTRNAYENFALSKYYCYTLFLIVCTCYLFECEDIGFVILIALIVSNLILIDDIMPIILPILSLCILPLRMYQGQESLMKLWPLGIHVAIAILFHIVYYKKKYRKSEFLKPLVAVSIALFAGGLFVIPVKDYFALNAIYYTFGLGPGIIAFYLFFRHYINPQKKYKTSHMLTNIANTIGVIVIAMLTIQYIQNVTPRIHAIPSWTPAQILTDRIIGGPLQFGNNLSTVLLMVTPFAFYKALHTKEKNYLYIVLGISECIAMIFTMSRSGILLGLFFIIFYAIYLFIDGKIEKKFTAVIAFWGPIMLVLLVLFFKYNFWRFLFALAFNSKEYEKSKLLILGLGIVSIAIVLYLFMDFMKKKGKDKKKILMVSEIVIIVGVAMMIFLWKYIFKAFGSIAGTRGEMANIAIINLFKYPLFGTGMGFTGMQHIYKPHGQMLNAYHSIVFQVIGSLGFVGMLAYGYFFHKKYALLLKLENDRFFYFSLPIIGLHIMSLINPGIIIPLPYAFFEILVLCIAENYLEEKGLKCT